MAENTEKDQVQPEENKQDTHATKDKRKLTEAEIRRSENFKAIEAGLLAQGYKRVDLTVSIMKANFTGVLLTVPVMAVLFIIFHLVTGRSAFLDVFSNHDLAGIVWMSILIVSCFILIFIHEGIHGLCWSIGAAGHLKDIEFGFVKEMLTPYCTCKTPLKKPVYIFGSMMPMTVLGLGISIPAIAVGNAFLLLIGIIQIIGGAGDILITTMLLFHKNSGKETVLLDHPYECGLVLFDK